MTPEEADNWRAVRTPLGLARSGHARYAAAMFFFNHGLLSDDVLEIYRLCAPLDAQDPLALLRDRDLGQNWIHRVTDAA